MGRIDNLNGSETRERARRQRVSERTSELGNTSVTEGETEFIGEESLKVIGSQIVEGRLIVEALFVADGQTHRLTITGDIDLSGDFTVDDNGKITVAGTSPMTIGITSNGRPGIEFAGGILSSAADRVALTKGDATVGVAPEFAAIAYKDRVVLLQEKGTTIQGPVFMPGLRTISGVSANVAVDPDTGELHTI
jgi:hypothetical protein